RRSVNSRTALAVSSLVCTPRITSTSGSNGTGLKKCMPTKRSGLPSVAASAVIEIDDVFDATIVSPLTADSICRRMRIFRSGFSGGGFDQGLAPRGALKRGRCLEGGERGAAPPRFVLPFLDQLREPRGRRRDPFSERGTRHVDEDPFHPPHRRYLRDAVAHR